MTRAPLLAAIFGALLFCLPAQAQDAVPLWAHVPETISPEWGPFLAERGLTRERPFPDPDDMAAVEAAQKAVSVPLEAMADEIAIQFGVTYRELEIGGVPVLEVTPENLVREDKIAVYTHGGAYVIHSAKSTLTSASLFAAATGLRVFSIDYTLAPQAQWQTITDEVLSVYKGLEEMGYAPRDTVLYGDSAGGSLAAGSVLKMRDQGMEMPAALVLWSPWSDIGEVGDSYVTLRDAELFYTYADTLAPSALAYADAADHTHPYVSPVYGDYTKGFPPTLIQGGTKEIFLSNFIRHYRAIDQAGQIAKLDLYEGMPHVFQGVLPDSKESRTALNKTAAWVDEHLLDDSSGTYHGTITDITRPESVWIGAIEVRLRAPFVMEEKRAEALTFMRALAEPGREATCRMTGERDGEPGTGTLFGHCSVFDPAEGRIVDLGEALIGGGFARPCSDNVATIAIWPPVFNCM